jgi:hypothetical protein
MCEELSTSPVVTKSVEAIFEAKERVPAILRTILSLAERAIYFARTVEPVLKIN